MRSVTVCCAMRKQAEHPLMSKLHISLARLTQGKEDQVQVCEDCRQVSMTNWLAGAGLSRPQ